MSPSEKILDKLSKLRAMQEGEAKLGNSAAAEAFAGMINAMLLKHELSATDIPLKSDVDPIVELFIDPRLHGIPFTRTRVAWQEALARIVGQAHLCKFLVSTGTNFITFVGTKDHVAFAEHAYVVLVNAATRMSSEARLEWWKRECGGKHLKSGNFRAAWLAGFIERIAERFDEVKRAEVAATGNESRALMRLDGQLTKAQAYVNEKYKRKASIVHLGDGNRDGRLAGRAAADGMTLGQRAVGGNGGKRHEGAQMMTFNVGDLVETVDPHYTGLSRVKRCGIVRAASATPGMVYVTWHGTKRVQLIDEAVLTPGRPRKP